MRKRILFDVGHPAQVHQFKHVYWKLAEKGWEGLFTAKDKEVTLQLLKSYNLPYVCIGRTKKGLGNKIVNLPWTIFKFAKIVRDFKPDIICSRFSPHSCWVSKVLGISHIGFADTEHTRLLDKITVPWVDLKVTPAAYQKDLGKNHFWFNGNIELFYLHPKIFIPNSEILKTLEIKEKDKYVVLRFVSWDAHHDLGQGGFSLEEKRMLVQKLSTSVKVLITSEKPLPPDLQKYQINVPAEHIHDILCYAQLYIGEGATMASEAALLGTPSIYVNSLTAGIIEEEIKYGLLFKFTNFKGVIDKAIELVQNSSNESENRIKLHDFLTDKINITEYVTWLVDNYPESKHQVLKDNNIQLRFK